MKKVRNLLLIFAFFIMMAILVPHNSFATTAEETEDIIKKIAPDGENATFYMKEPTSFEEADFLLNGYIGRLLGGEDYNLYADYIIEESKCMISFSSKDYMPEHPDYMNWDHSTAQPPMIPETGWMREYVVNATFVEPSSNAIVNSIFNKLKPFNMMDPNMDNNYIIEDLALINYYNTSVNSELWNPGAPGRALKYSSINEITKGLNITYYLDIRAGIQDETLMYESAFGPMSIFYNGYSYGTKEQGLYLRRVLYIPEETENSSAAYAAAAQERISDYLGNDSVTVVYGGTLSSLGEEAQDMENPVTGHDGNYYNVTVKGRTYKFYILKGTAAQMTAPTYIGTDIVSNIEVTSEDSSIPLDASLTVKNVNDSTIKEKIGTENYKSYDISLYSDAKNAKIEKLENGKFEVKIPVPTELEGKELTVYYFTTTGEKQQHDVTIKDGFAVFTTDHFSVYTLAENTAAESTTETSKGEKDDTPKTGRIDMIGYIVFAVVLSGTGLVVLKKNN